MKPIIRLFAALIILSLGMLACNLPSTTPKPQPPDLSNALTLAVQTIQAATQQAQPNVPATPVAPAATPSTPIVSVSSATNCRTGPGTNYDLVLTFQPGATAEVVGKYSPSNYWIIKTPTGGTCWLWGAYATVQGNVNALAELAPPAPPQVAAAPTTVPNSGSSSSSSSGSNPSPTPTPKKLVVNPNLINPNIIKAIAFPPAAPAKLTVSTNCQYTYFPTKLLMGRIDSLSWTSVSNATGYYVYMNGGKLASVTGTSYPITFNLTANATTFGVVAYNSNGTSGTTSASSHCP